MNENIFDKLDFGPFRSLLDNDDITDISFDNNGQIWIRSLTQGSLRVEVSGATPEFVEKLAFQCSNVMGTTFNNAKPFLDAESTELRLNFVHPSIATNGIAMVIRKTPAKIRLEKEKLIEEDYFSQDIHDILIKCVEGHCNIIVAGETGSGKTEFVKYLASHTKTNEKIITIEDTLELHLDKIFPQRDIVAMKTNNVASYTDVLVTCMRQNPKWILLSEVRSAEAVTAVRNSISSGHNILSTIHADKASAIPYRLYSLMETDIDVNQFLSTIYRYIQLGVHIRAYYSKEREKFHREADEVVESYVDEDNQPKSRVIYQKIFGKEPILRKPSQHLIEYLENQNIDINSITDKMIDEVQFEEDVDEEEYETEVELTSEENETAYETETEVTEETYESQETEEDEKESTEESSVEVSIETEDETPSSEEINYEENIQQDTEIEESNENQVTGMIQGESVELPSPVEEKEETPVAIEIAAPETAEEPQHANMTPVVPLAPVAPQPAVPLQPIAIEVPKVPTQPAQPQPMPPQQAPQQVVPPQPMMTQPQQIMPPHQQMAQPQQVLQPIPQQPMNNQPIQQVAPMQQPMARPQMPNQQPMMQPPMPQQQMVPPQSGILPFMPANNGQMPPGIA